MAVAVVLTTGLFPRAADAYTICRIYNDGCTICDFYSPDGTYRGYIEFCH